MTKEEKRKQCNAIINGIGEVMHGNHSEICFDALVFTVANMCAKYFDYSELDAFMDTFDTEVRIAFKEYKDRWAN